MARSLSAFSKASSAFSFVSSPAIFPAARFSAFLFTRWYLVEIRQTSLTNAVCSSRIHNLLIAKKYISMPILGTWWFTTTILSRRSHKIHAPLASFFTNFAQTEGLPQLYSWVERGTMKVTFPTTQHQKTPPKAQTWTAQIPPPKLKDQIIIIILTAKWFV